MVNYNLYNHFGDNENYTYFESDGTLVCKGNATTYNDINMPLSTGRIGGSNNPSWSSFNGNLFLYTFTVNDYIQVAGQELLHDWKEGSSIELHVHWANNGVDTSDRGVKWEIEYTWANMKLAGNDIVFSSPLAPSSETIIPANTPSLTHFYTSVTTFTPNGKIGAYLIMRLKRIASVTNIAPTNNPFGIAVGIHYEKNTMGSRQIATK